MITLAFLNSPAHLLTAIEASEKINDREPIKINTKGRPRSLASAIRKRAAICINRIAAIYIKTGIFILSVLPMNLGTVKTSIKSAGIIRNKPHKLNAV